MIDLRWSPLSRRFILPLLLLGISSFSFAQHITYAKHIAPIIQYHCTGCHQKGEVAPIPLTTYEEVSSYASMIAYVTRTRYMPPWQVTQPENTFHSERRLTLAQIDLIQQWIDGGLLQGEQKNNNTFSKAVTPKISDPDVVYAMAESFEQYGVYYDQFRVFVIPTDLKEDREVTSIAFVPGNKSIVRSCQISIDTTGKSIPFDEWDPQYGYFSFGELGFAPMESRWYNWHPKKPVTHFPEGMGKLLPKGSKILMHIHYGPTGVAQKDSSYLQIKFAKKKIKTPVFTAPLIHPFNMTNDTFLLPANETVRVHAKFVVPFDLVLHGVFPQSHLLGKRWEIFTVDPTKKNSEVLLKIENWDFKWKQMYDFKEPKILRKGTVVHALAAYDNTLDNLSNPSNPPHQMAWGKRMFQELFFVFFKFSEWQGEEVPASFEIALNKVNTTDPDFEFKVIASKPVSLKGHLISFDGLYNRLLFDNKIFEKGTHAINASLMNLPKGNYYLELQEDSTMEVVRRVILYLEDTVFE